MCTTLSFFDILVYYVLYIYLYIYRHTKKIVKNMFFF